MKKKDIIYINNREGLEEYNITYKVSGRPLGLSAMLRVKNEEEWIGACLESIVNWFDEVVICLQNCTDRTAEIVAASIINYPQCRVYEYPYDSLPNGPGYCKQDPGSIHSRTYFYNWCLAKTRFSHVCKWDGDMVAMDWLGNRIRELVIRNSIDVVNIFGVDIVGKDLNHTGSHEYCAVEPRVFRIEERTRYINGSMCEKLRLGSSHVTIAVRIQKPAFLHFKWAKSIDSATKAWPIDWKSIPHFRGLIKRSIPVKEYQGEYPMMLLRRMHG